MRAASRVHQRRRPRQGDGWVDAKGMFLAAAGAGPVYRLLGKKDMGTTEFPPGRTAADRRRRRLPPAQRRAYARPELADFPHVRRPFYQEPDAPAMMPDATHFRYGSALRRCFANRRFLSEHVLEFVKRRCVEL